MLWISLLLTRFPSLPTPCRWQDSDAPAWPLFVPGIILIGFDYVAVLFDLFMRPAEVTGVHVLREQQRPPRAAREGASAPSTAPAETIPVALQLTLRK